ncbi:MAG TPA: hypothetical protein VF939_23900 [Puia sp.]
MLKQIPVILLFIGFLGQTFSKNLIFLNYQLNKDYIAANLCENRDKPQMKCEGRCYLCKRLKNEEKKDQENPERRAENKFESIPFQLGFALTHPASRIIIVNYPRFQEAIYNSFMLSFFHPPQC